MKDQEFQLEPYSKSLFDVIKMGLLSAAALYVVLLVFDAYLDRILEQQFFSRGCSVSMHGSAAACLS